MPASPIVGGPRTRGRSPSRARGSRAGRRPTRCSSAVAPRRLALTPCAKKRCRTQRATPSRPLRQVCMMSCIRGSSIRLASISSPSNTGLWIVGSPRWRRASTRGWTLSLPIRTEPACRGRPRGHHGRGDGGRRLVAEGRIDALPGARPELLERPVGPRDADDRPVEMAAPGHRLETREYLLRHDRALRPAREIAAGPLPPRARASRPIAHPAPLRHIAPSPTAGIIERVCARRWRPGGGTGRGPPRSLAPRARAAVPLRPSARA